MEAVLSPSEAAKHTLILAAMRLLAEYGVDSVSLRMINRESGSKNNSALHYHFGSKLGLIEALIEFAQQHFNDVRESQLRALEARAQADGITVRDVTDVFTQAYVDILEGQEWGYAAVRTFARMEFDSNEEVHALLNRVEGVALQRFSKLFRPLLPTLSPRVFKQRLHLFVSATRQGFASYHNLGSATPGTFSVKSLNDLAELYSEMGATTLQAPC